MNDEQPRPHLGIEGYQIEKAIKRSRDAQRFLDEQKTQDHLDEMNRRLMRNERNIQAAQPEPMNEARARAILATLMTCKGTIANTIWEPGETTASMYGEWLPDELEALAWWMRNMGEKL